MSSKASMHFTRCHLFNVHNLANRYLCKDLVNRTIASLFLCLSLDVTAKQLARTYFVIYVLQLQLMQLDNEVVHIYRTHFLRYSCPAGRHILGEIVCQNRILVYPWTHFLAHRFFYSTDMKTGLTCTQNLTTFLDFEFNKFCHPGSHSYYNMLYTYINHMIDTTQPHMQQ